MNVITFPMAWQEGNLPDGAFRTTDDVGRPMFQFIADYKLDGRTFSINLWAYDIDDAERRVASMRDCLELQGQILCEVSL